MTDSNQIDQPGEMVRTRPLVSGLRVTAIVLGFVLLYIFYISDVGNNPPGFYIDESAIAYNSYCIAKTGANEFGTRFPLFFPVYTGAWTQYANPTQIYLLAIPFTIFKPSILVARVYSASWVFAACLLLGWLAKRISGKDTVGLMVAVIAIFTPWLFEVSRLVMETFFYPMALVLFLLALHAAQKKDNWPWLNVLWLAVTLMLLTYSYTIGRLLGPLLAGGLILFATSQPRIISIVKTWAVFAFTLIPLLIFRAKNPEALTQRFYLISYIKPDTPWSQIIPKFFHRYLEDLSLISLLFDGDGNPRHHVYGSLGAFLIGAFVLVVIGIVVIGVRHWHEPFWRFVVFGAAASIVPGALTADQFHSLRIVGYPIFLLTLMIPAINVFFGNGNFEAGSRTDAAPQKRSLSLWPRRVIGALLLIGAAAQVIYFQSVFRREGPNRGVFFDAQYKDVYDAAIASSAQPIFLIDGNQPSYEHALWYATVEGRQREMFIHLEEGFVPPAGAIVISSEEHCFNCIMIKKSGGYLLYRVPQEYLRQ
jgi:4-amino-4-deoxy-L-arabinose transferase-like glycosyltransferase